MSSKRGLRRRRRRAGCEGKVPHATESAALFHSRELYLAKKARPGTLNVYRCRDCGTYHVGHRRGMKPLASTGRPS